MKQIKALLKSPGDTSFREILVDNELGALQRMVGGHIEVLGLALDACMICNEEGKLIGMPFNCNYLGAEMVGPILIVGSKGDEFCSCPWSVTIANKGIVR